MLKKYSLMVMVLIIVAMLAGGCGGGGDTVIDILTSVPTGSFTGTLGTGEIAGAWHLWMMSASGGQMRDYYFIAEQTSSTTGIAFLSGPFGMTWVEIVASGVSYSFAVSEYYPRSDFQSLYVYTGTRTDNNITGSFIGEARDNFFTSNAGNFTGSFMAEIVPIGAEFVTPTMDGVGTINGAMGNGLTDIELAGDISYEISGYDVTGTLTFDILDDYGMPTGDQLVDLPFTGILSGGEYNQFTSTFDIDQNGWTGNGTLVGYMADVTLPSSAWDYAFVSNGKFTLSNVTGHGHTAWGFRGGWSANGN